MKAEWDPHCYQLELCSLSVFSLSYFEGYQDPWSSYGTPGLWLACPKVPLSSAKPTQYGPLKWMFTVKYHYQVLTHPAAYTVPLGSNFLKLCQHLITYLALYIDQLASPWLWEMRQACEVYNACIVCSHFQCLASHRYHRAQRRKRGLKEGGVVEDSMEKAERLRAKVKCVGVTSEHHLHVLPAIRERIWEKVPLCTKWAPQPFYILKKSNVGKCKVVLVQWRRNFLPGFKSVAITALKLHVCKLKTKN